MRHVRRLLAVMWVAVPPILLSALVHMSDPDIGGWRALTSYSVLWSVSFFGVLAAACSGFCTVVLVESGRVSFGIAAGLFSSLTGGFLAAFGSGATSIPGLIWSFAASTVLVFLVVLAAAVPAVALGWPQALTRRELENHT
jgi:hypothetical protein